MGGFDAGFMVLGSGSSFWVRIQSAWFERCLGARERPERHPRNRRDNVDCVHDRRGRGEDCEDQTAAHAHLRTRRGNKGA